MRDGFSAGLQQPTSQPQAVGRLGDLKLPLGGNLSPGDQQVAEDDRHHGSEYGRRRVGEEHDRGDCRTDQQQAEHEPEAEQMRGNHLGAAYGEDRSLSWFRRVIGQAMCQCKQLGAHRDRSVFVEVGEFCAAGVVAGENEAQLGDTEDSGEQWSHEVDALDPGERYADLLPAEESGVDLELAAVHSPFRHPPVDEAGDRGDHYGHTVKPGRSMLIGTIGDDHREQSGGRATGANNR